MSPLEEAFHDFADANQGAEGYDCFAGGWEARQPEIDLLTEQIEKLRAFWQVRVSSVEGERNEAMMKLASACYERDAFRRQRDAVAGLLADRP